ncbi:MAG TPA: alginate export family protein [Gemmataceae bacterium]|jgi:hypothetical protein|nr:alginate export family protein [Gemmataceae bacterium]
MNSLDRLANILRTTAWSVSLTMAAGVSAVAAQTPVPASVVKQSDFAVDALPPATIMTPTAQAIGTPEAAAPMKTAVPPTGVLEPLATLSPSDVISSAPAATLASPKWQTPLPRVGNIVIPQSGPGYYSALDQIMGQCREGPPKYPYPRVSPIMIPNYDVNWSYLKDPNNTDWDYADSLKWIPVCDGVTFTTGGEFRYQFRNDVNSNNRLTGVADAYNLYRTRAYGDLWVQDWLRFYGEFIYADYTNRTLAPLLPESNRGDVLDLFADVRVFGDDASPVYLRVGRQELIYGSQRLISSSDWFNTRRPFQGVKAFTRTENWDLDVFAVQPVLVQAGRLDEVDHNQWFSGAWFTYRPSAGQNVDLYYLNLDNSNRGVAIGRNGVKGTYNVSTLGARYTGTLDNWLWDAEGMLQFGSHANQSIMANAFSVYGGYDFKGVFWNPQLWVGVDHASGDSNPGLTGTRHTFNQLFPFGHYYFGYTDLVGRQNVNDVMVQAAVFPENWITCVAQFHTLRLDSSRDALYGAAGAVVRQDKTGRAGNNIGNEVDFTTNFHLTNHSDVLIGYSQLFAGSFIKNTTPPGNAARRAAQEVDPSVFYVQYSYRW